MPHQRLCAIRRHVVARGLKRGETRRKPVFLNKRSAPLAESRLGSVAIQISVVERVAERLQAVDATRLADRWARLDDGSGSAGNLAEPCAQLLEQPRAARHGIVENGISELRAWLTNDKYLEVLSIHIEDLRCAD